MQLRVIAVFVKLDLQEKTAKFTPMNANFLLVSTDLVQTCLMTINAPVTLGIRGEIAPQ